ncbi:MAG: hypothetical protein ACI89X_000710 [Planctomycetota bacterium]|jgi:hypothetical protein
MDPDGDITDAFDDNELAKTIESGQKGPWNDDSAVFEDPKLADLKSKMAGGKSTDYQQRRLRELQKRTAMTSATTSAASSEQTTTTPSWGETESHWDEQDSSNELTGNLDWADSPPTEGAISMPSTSNTATPNNEQATKPAPNYARAAIAVASVLGAGTVSHGLLVDWNIDIWCAGIGLAAIIAGAWFGMPRTEASR